MLGGRKEKATMSDKHNDPIVVLSDGETYDRSATILWMPQEWPSELVEESLRHDGPGTVTVAEVVQALVNMANALDKPDEIRDRIYEQIDLLERINAS
jgi:hypothetical protein